MTPASSRALMPFRERITRILDEVRGVKSSYGITSWEWDRLNEWKELSWGSDKQNAIVEAIEKRVFDASGEGQ